MLQAANIFFILDSRHSGGLHQDNFKELMRVIHKAEGKTGAPDGARITNSFRLADNNNDGEVDFNELLRFHALYVEPPLQKLYDQLTQDDSFRATRTRT